MKYIISSLDLLDGVSGVVGEIFFRSDIFLQYGAATKTRQYKKPSASFAIPRKIQTWSRILGAPG